MPNSKFDAKSFNAEAFKYMVNRVPNVKRNELKKSRALAGDADIRNVFSSQNGTAYARLAMRGLLDGDTVNYDGETDITATSTKTFEQGVVVFGRAKGWIEKDFSFDITGGVDFMKNVAAQVKEYWDEKDQNTLLSVLKGIFSMTGYKNREFVNKHTFKVSGNMTAVSMNSATQQACGDNKKKFTLCIMHSVVATNLENLKVLSFLTQTDKDGLTREIGLATWNGKLVLIDDSMPVEITETTAGVYKATISTKAASGDKVTINGVTLIAGTDFSLSTDTATGNAAAIAAALNASTSANVSGYTWSNDGAKIVATEDSGHYGEGAFDVTVEKGASGTLVIAAPVTATAPVIGEEYTTYVLGVGAIRFEDIGAKVPYEMARNAAHNGGEDTLYTRHRKVISPFGISYEKAVQASLSPTDAEFENGANWTLVHSGESAEADRTYINHRAIPILRIKSNG